MDTHNSSFTIEDGDNRLTVYDDRWEVNGKPLGRETGMALDWIVLHARGCNTAGDYLDDALSTMTKTSFGWVNIWELCYWIRYNFEWVEET